MQCIFGYCAHLPLLTIKHTTPDMLILPAVLMNLRDFMKEQKNMALARLAS